jgi:hypothetical protein
MTDTGINSNASMPRKQLSSQLDRLDTILDGLADALNESVADAVKDVVGQVVKESVETTIREVLGNPALLQAALEKHTPQPILTPKRSLKEVLKNALTTLVSVTCQAAGKARSAVGWAWSWAVNKLRQGLWLVKSGCQVAGHLIMSTTGYAWHCRWTCAAAVGSGVLSGVGVYYAGPVVASVLCGVGSSLATAVGIALAPVWRLLLGSDHGV